LPSANVTLKFLPCTFLAPPSVQSRLLSRCFSPERAGDHQVEHAADTEYHSARSPLAIGSTSRRAPIPHSIACMFAFYGLCTGHIPSPGSPETCKQPGLGSTPTVRYFQPLSVAGSSRPRPAARWTLNYALLRWGSPLRILHSNGTWVHMPSLAPAASTWQSHTRRSIPSSARLPTGSL
jgi:hypothetical protein